MHKHNDKLTMLNMKSKQTMNIIMKNINKNNTNNVIAIVPSIRIMEIQ